MMTKISIFDNDHPFKLSFQILDKPEDSRKSLSVMTVLYVLGQEFNSY